MLASLGAEVQAPPPALTQPLVPASWVSAPVALVPPEHADDVVAAGDVDAGRRALLVGRDADRPGDVREARAGDLRQRPGGLVALEHEDVGAVDGIQRLPVARDHHVHDGAEAEPACAPRARADAAGLVGELLERALRAAVERGDPAGPADIHVAAERGDRLSPAQAVGAATTGDGRRAETELLVRAVVVELLPPARLRVLGQRDHGVAAGGGDIGVAADRDDVVRAGQAMAVGDTEGRCLPACSRPGCCPNPS